MVDRNSSVPLHLQIRNILRSEILEERYRDANLPGELQLVERFGVSRGTVRQALRSLEQLGFIRRARGKGTLIISNEQAELPSSTNPIIVSLIVPHCRDSFVPTLLLGVEMAMRERSARLFFNHTEKSIDLQNNALNAARDYGVSGIILLPVDVSYQDPVLKQLNLEKFPIVLVDRYIYGLDIDYVTTDGYGGMLRAVQHLLALGHRRIGFVCFSLEHTGQMCRFLGYQQALLEWDIPSDPSLVCELAELPDENLEALHQYLTSPNRPTAIVALNDYLAVKIINLCRQSGIRIPDELALVGFDDIDIAAQLETPLTTVTQPIYEMGYQAAQLLLNKISGRSSGIQRIILPTHLTIRKSCGARMAPSMPVAT